MPPALVDARSQLLQGLANRQSEARRPILTSLNGDNSWLLSIPRPAADSAEKREKAYYHVLMDPWLAGPAIVISTWIGSLTRPNEPSFESVAAVETLISDIETAEGRRPARQGHGEEEAKGRGTSLVDAVLVTNEQPDHAHHATLLQVDQAVPVFTTAVAAPVIRSWHHFDTVVALPGSAGAAWTEDHPPELPAWLSMHALTTPTWLKSIQNGIVVAFGAATTERILMLPHGIDPALVAAAAAEEARPVRTLALLTGVNEESALGIGVPGATNGLALERATRARYWVRTHDGEHAYWGPVFWGSVRKTVRTLGWALDREEEGGAGALSAKREAPNFCDVGNGQSLVLV